MVVDNRDYENDRAELKTFLTTWQAKDADDASGKSNYVYQNALSRIAKRESDMLVVELSDVLDYNQELCDAIIGNTMHYVNLLSEVVDDLLPEYEPVRR